MHSRPRTHIVTYALLFWLTAVWRFTTYEPLQHLFGATLRAVCQRWLAPPLATLPVEVSALDLPRLPDGSQPRLVAQVRLNGRVIWQLASQRAGETLTLQLPASARGLLEVSVAALGSATCMIAGASERRWLDVDAARGAVPPLAFALPLHPFATPLCA